MRIIQASCTIRYIGRCETFLPEATRLVIVKDDGSVMVHVDSGIKPLNYMKASKQLGFIKLGDDDVLYAANSKEELYVTLLEIYQDVFLPFPDSEREMVKTGTEDLLQEEIYENIEELIPGSTGVCREFETGKGPIDVLGMKKDKSGLDLVEVKRHAHRKDVYQVLKYDDGVALMVEEAKEKGFSAIEAKQKGDHDERGVMLPLETLENRDLYLAARKFARGTKEEAAEHGVNILDMAEAEEEWGIVQLDKQL